MFIRFIALFCLLFPNVLSASDKPDEPLTPFKQILRMHEVKPFDFIALASEAAQLRADYARVALRVLRSEELSLDQRIDFARNLDQNFDFYVKELGPKPGYADKTSIEMNEISKRTEMPEMAGPYQSIEHMHLCSTLFDMYKNANLWSFVSRSLRAYGEAPNRQSLEYTHRLLMELTVLCQYADSDVQISGMLKGYCENKLYIDEDHYARCILETVFLHAKLVLKFSDDQLPVSKLIYVSLNQPDCDKLGLDGLGRSFCLFNVDSALNKRTQVEKKTVLFEVGQELKRPLVIPNEKKVCELNDYLSAHGYYNDLTIPYLLEKFKPCRLKENTPIEVLRYIRGYCMTPDCYSLTPYINKVLADTRARVQASFVIDLPKPKAKKPSPNNKKNNQAKQVPKAQEVVMIEEVTKESAVIPPIASKGPIAPKVKLPTAKQKLVARKAAKAEAAAAAMEPLMRRAAAKEEENARNIESIQVSFGEGLCPSAEELALYDLIWGPDSARKALCWANLKSQLESFGWAISESQGGSYVTLRPPEWFSQVKVVAPQELNIHFRASPFLLHHPHDVAQAPMPIYVIAFLREQLGSNIGLSDIVVKAMIRKLNEKCP